MSTANAALARVREAEQQQAIDRQSLEAEKRKAQAALNTFALRVAIGISTSSIEIGRLSRFW